MSLCAHSNTRTKCAARTHTHTHISHPHTANTKLSSIPWNNPPTKQNLKINHHTHTPVVHSFSLRSHLLVLVWSSQHIPHQQLCVCVCACACLSLCLHVRVCVCICIHNRCKKDFLDVEESVCDSRCNLISHCFAGLCVLSPGPRIREVVPFF